MKTQEKNQVSAVSVKVFTRGAAFFVKCWQTSLYKPVKGVLAPESAELDYLLEKEFFTAYGENGIFAQNHSFNY